MIKKEQIVFIIDDDEDVRDSLYELICSIGLHARIYSSAPEFLNEFKSDMPGCILTDVRMPIMSGLELQQKLNEMQAKQPLIIMTGHGDINMAVQAMKQGAFEFLQKPFRDQELLDCIGKALEHEKLIRQHQEEQETSRAKIESLTTRERQVIDLVLEGKANKVIARELGISDRTVEIHRSHATEKLGVHSVAELVKFMLNSSV